MSRKRPTLASSRAASTSSRKQNGTGLARKRAKRSATAVRARSPPDSSERLWARLPGGCAMMSMPVVVMLSGSVTMSSAEPPANSVPKYSRKERFTSRMVAPRSCSMTPSSSSMISCRLAMAPRRSAAWLWRNVWRSRSCSYSWGALGLMLPSRRMRVRSCRMSSFREGGMAVTTGSSTTSSPRLSRSCCDAAPGSSMGPKSSSISRANACSSSRARSRSRIPRWYSASARLRSSSA